MKKLIAAAAFVTLIAVPAVAQSWDPSVGDGNLVPYGETVNGASVYQNDTAGFNARGEVRRGLRSNQVMDETGHVQTDPDLNIRSQLQREDNEF